MKSLLASSIIVTFWLAKMAQAGPEVTAAADAIDALLAKDWAANKLTPNAPADDSIFVRRIYLDVVGRIPTTREAEEFLASKEEGKRAALCFSMPTRWWTNARSGTCLPTRRSSFCRPVMHCFTRRRCSIAKANSCKHLQIQRSHL